MMLKLIKLVLFTFVIGISQTKSYAQISKNDTHTNEIEIPPEILDRIPKSELSQFIVARQRAIQSKGNKVIDAYQEIGVNKSIVERIPSSDLFGFLIERGYVEVIKHEDISLHPGHSAPPPAEMLKLLYSLIFMVGGLVFTSFVLAHLYRRKNQEIIIKALETNQDIPFNILKLNEQKRYFNYAVVLSSISIGIMILGFKGILPGSLAIFPFSIAIGYFILSYLDKR